MLEGLLGMQARKSDVTEDKQVFGQKPLRKSLGYSPRNTNKDLSEMSYSDSNCRGFALFL